LSWRLENFPQQRRQQWSVFATFVIDRFRDGFSAEPFPACIFGRKNHIVTRRHGVVIPRDSEFGSGRDELMAQAILQVKAGT
jgi:hypothetical protein